MIHIHYTYEYDLFSYGDVEDMKVKTSPDEIAKRGSI